MDNRKRVPEGVAENVMANCALDFLTEAIRDLWKAHQLGSKRKA